MSDLYVLGVGYPVVYRRNGVLYGLMEETDATQVSVVVERSYFCPSLGCLFTAVPSLVHAPEPTFHHPAPLHNKSLMTQFGVHRAHLATQTM